MAKSKSKQNYTSSKGRNGRKGSDNYSTRGGKGASDKKFVDMETGRDCTKGTPNDVSWYAQNSQMLVDAASLAFNQMVGAPYSISYSINESPTSDTKYIPGIMTLGWAPSIGVSVSENSAINIAARNLYSFVRHANSGHTNYDPADLMMYVLAVDSCYAFHASLVRAYGCMRYYMQTNRYLAKHLVAALGFSYSSLESALANFRYMINEYALKINSLAVPNAIPFFARHMWMNSHVYMDRPGIKAQLYAYKQAGYCKFVEMESEDVPYGTLHWTPAPAALNLNTAANFANALIDPIISSEAMNIMSGDILKAFGSSGILSVPAISEDYTVIPEYNFEVLHQMHNFVGTGDIFVAENEPFITQDPWTGNIEHTPRVIRDTNNLVWNGALLDMHVDTPTAGDVMVSTRMMANCKDTADATLNGKFIYFVNHCGSEIPTTLQIYTLGGVNGSLTNFATTNELMLDDAETALKLARITAFDMHPTIYAFKTKDDATAGVDIIGPVGDLDNFVPIHAVNIARMHECALLSELAVPSMGVFNAQKHS